MPPVDSSSSSSGGRDVSKGEKDKWVGRVGPNRESVSLVEATSVGGIARKVVRSTKQLLQRIIFRIVKLRSLKLHALVSSLIEINDS